MPVSQAFLCVYVCACMLGGEVGFNLKMGSEGREGRKPITLQFPLYCYKQSKRLLQRSDARAVK